MKVDIVFERHRFTVQVGISICMHIKTFELEHELVYACMYALSV